MQKYIKYHRLTQRLNLNGTVSFILKPPNFNSTGFYCKIFGLILCFDCNCISSMCNFLVSQDTDSCGIPQIFASVDLPTNFCIVFDPHFSAEIYKTMQKSESIIFKTIQNHSLYTNRCKTMWMFVSKYIKLYRNLHLNCRVSNAEIRIRTGKCEYPH